MPATPKWLNHCTTSQKRSLLFGGLISIQLSRPSGGALISPNLAPTPIAESRFVPDTNASAEAIGAKLSQVQVGKRGPYGSLRLSFEKRRYCTTRKELLALVN